MRKYLTLFQLSWQKQLEVRSDFFFERTRAISILLSLYFLWSALLVHRPAVLGYSRAQLLTYVLMMTLLRAWVLACVTDRIPTEIARGKLSDVLLHPISHLGFWATQDAANKSLNIVSSIFEVAIFAWLTKAPLSPPADAFHAIGFVLSTVAAMILYFQMSYMLGVIGFWTAESWGPRFCFEIILEFCAGAYFPIDLLPVAAQKVLSALPFPYLVFYPLSIYLGRVNEHEVLRCLGIQLVWIAVMTFGVQILWAKGLRKYAAEGR